MHILGTLERGWFYHSHSKRITYRAAWLIGLAVLLYDDLLGSSSPRVRSLFFPLGFAERHIGTCPATHLKLPSFFRPHTRGEWSNRTRASLSKQGFHSLFQYNSTTHVETCGIENPKLLSLAGVTDIALSVYSSRIDTARRKRFGENRAGRNRAYMYEY